MNKVEHSQLVNIRIAGFNDAASIVSIYNEGIRERRSTFETRERQADEILSWLNQERYPILVAELENKVVGWIAASAYRNRECYVGVAEFSVYVTASCRNQKLGHQLLQQFIFKCKEAGVWKLISRIFPENAASRALCARHGFREVGVYQSHAILDGRWRDTSLRRQLATSSKAQEATFELIDPYKTYLCDSPPTNVTVTKDQLLHYYREMVMVRRMETAADGLYKSKMIRGFCHLCNGQEAVPVGIESALTKDDAIITAYRCHGYTYTRGGSVKSILAELMGRRDGIAKGKGGSMHMFAPGFYGGNGIVGAQVPMGAGIAFAQKYQEKNACTFSLYGDGAANQGQVFEAYNMAKLWNLPCVFVCENNQYGMGTSAKRSSGSTEYFTRAGYIAGIKVNGMDILAVHEATKYAREWTTSGKGPMLLEMVTYRYGGHSMSDPGTTYRTREEIQHMRSTSDPVTGLKTRILEAKFATEAELKAIDKECRAHVDQAMEEARASPEPEMSELWTDIYKKGSEPKFLRAVEPQDVHHYSQ